MAMSHGYIPWQSTGYSACKLIELKALAFRPYNFIGKLCQPARRVSTKQPIVVVVDPSIALAYISMGIRIIIVEAIAEG